MYITFEEEKPMDQEEVKPTGASAEIEIAEPGFTPSRLKKGEEMAEVISNAITKRPEIVVALHGDYGALARVGEYGVTAIEPYDEYGEMSYVPWFNVWRGNTLYLKFNAAHVRSIEYKQPHTDAF